MQEFLIELELSTQALQKPKWEIFYAFLMQDDEKQGAEQKNRCLEQRRSVTNKGWKWVNA